VNSSVVIERDDLIAPYAACSTARRPADRLARHPQGGGFGNPLALACTVWRRRRDDGRDFSGRHSEGGAVARHVGGELGGGDDMIHWNYWRRELLITPPRSWPSAARAGSAALLWCRRATGQCGLACMKRSSITIGGQWPIARYGLAAPSGPTERRVCPPWQAPIIPGWGRTCSGVSHGSAVLAPWITTRGGWRRSWASGVQSPLCPAHPRLLHVCVLNAGDCSTRSTIAVDSRPPGCLSDQPHVAL
jgi:hypothetical protein